MPIRPSGTGMFETGQSSRMRNLDMSRGQMRLLRITMAMLPGLESDVPIGRLARKASSAKWDLGTNSVFTPGPREDKVKAGVAR